MHKIEFIKIIKIVLMYFMFILPMKTGIFDKDVFAVIQNNFAANK